MKPSVTAPRAWIAPLLAAGVIALASLGVACSEGVFSGGTGSSSSAPKKDLVKGGPDDSGGPSTLKVPVGGKRELPIPDGESPKNCIVADAEIASVDPVTCKVTGEKPGTTTVTAELPDGTTHVVDIIVTDDPNDTPDDPEPGEIGGNGGPHEGDDPNLIVEDGKVTKIVGRVCLSGPGCNVSFLMRTEKDAQECMAKANGLPVENDPQAKNESHMLQICNCTCESSSGLPVDAPDDCRRFNPLKAGAKSPITQCRRN